MKNYIQKKLISAGENFVPNNLDKILAQNLNKEADFAITNSVPQRKQNVRKKWLRLACAAAAMLILSIGFISGYQYMNADSYYVYLDINPSIEFTVNRFDKITNVNFLNDDARNMLQNEKLKGKAINTAVEIYLKKAKDKDYLKTNENEIFLSVLDTKYNNNKREVKKISDKITEILNSNNLNGKLEKVEIKRDMIDKMNDLEISPARMILINEILDKKELNYSLDKLKDMSVKELKNILNEN